MTTAKDYIEQLYEAAVLTVGAVAVSYASRTHVNTNELSIGKDGELASNVDYVFTKFFPKTHTLTSQDTSQNQKKTVSQKLEKQ